MDCSLLCSSVHGIFQARALEWVAISFSRKGSSWPRDRTQVSRTVGRCFTIWATREGYRKLFKKGSTTCSHRESSPWHVKYKAVYIYYLGDKVCRRISTQIWLLVMSCIEGWNWGAGLWEWTLLFILYPFVHLNFIPLLYRILFLQNTIIF